LSMMAYSTIHSWFPQFRKQFVKQANLEEMALGMLCHKNVSNFWKWGRPVRPPYSGTFCHTKNWGRFVQRTDHPGDGLSMGRFVLGTHHYKNRGDGPLLGRVVRGRIVRVPYCRDILYFGTSAYFKLIWITEKILRLNFIIRFLYFLQETTKNIRKCI
jgi:hypothetical protein